MFRDVYAGTNQVMSDRDRTAVNGFTRLGQFRLILGPVNCGLDRSLTGPWKQLAERRQLAAA